jgi:glutamate dehydrogenase
MSSTPSQPPPGPGVLLDPNMTHLNDYFRASSRASSEASLQRVKNLPGYTTPVFKGKEEQRAKVQADVALKVPRYPYPRAQSSLRIASYTRDSFLGS